MISYKIPKNLSVKLYFSRNCILLDPDPNPHSECRSRSTDPIELNGSDRIRITVSKLIFSRNKKRVWPGDLWCYPGLVPSVWGDFGSLKLPFFPVLHGIIQQEKYYQGRQGENPRPHCKTTQISFYNNKN